MQTIKRWVFSLGFIAIAILIGLYVAGILKKKIEYAAPSPKPEVASLMMIDHARAFNKLKKQWMATTLIPQDQAERRAKINRFIALNKKVISSYKKELYNLMKLGLKDQGPEMNFVREKMHEGILDNALLERELQRFSQGISPQERQKIMELITINRECVDCCRQEIDSYRTMGMHEADPRLQDAHARLAQAMAEIGQLEPVIQ